MGPHCANVFNPSLWADDSDAITLEVMRVVLAIGLFAIGVELPKSYMYKHAKSLLIMVVPTMAFGWVMSAGMFTSSHSDKDVLIKQCPQHLYLSYFLT